MTAEAGKRLVEKRIMQKLPILVADQLLSIIRLRRLDTFDYDWTDQVLRDKYRNKSKQGVSAVHITTKVMPTAELDLLCTRSLLSLFTLHTMAVGSRPYRQ
jgi:hypothetical protein